ncbi:MAG: HTTM domain-containing protein [Saprospiraceae bacterium]|nr:HTTM domain-containing protein [Saprospiraceae bacterium]
MKFDLNTYFKSNINAAPLAFFRICFGLMMFISIIRFWAYGWIEKFYIEPKFFFSFYGFDWVHPIGPYTYVVFVLCGISALFVALGFKYRFSIIMFFLSFTFIELMDKTTYLNHYYFISLLSFLMIFLPAGVYYSVDSYRDNSKAYTYIPRWTIDSIKLLLGIVYFYAGLAKLQPDWLLDAMPLKIWLPARYDLPILGDLLQQSWVHYSFSWGGALYDLFIPFLLLFKRTRLFAFAMVVVFHALTRILFPIGMFPYIMIVSALIFFDPDIHIRILNKVSSLLRIDPSTWKNRGELVLKNSSKNSIKNGVLIAFFALQILIPFRFLFYPGHLFWTEQGFRFSWRVMLMEKAGYANFKVVDAKSGKRFYVDNLDFLTVQQEKMMSTQPDMILQYAHFLGAHFESQGHQNVEIYVESYVALNGRKSEPFIDPSKNLLDLKEDFGHKEWILPWKGN